MNTIPDKFAQWDAAYVLGALSPAERREFEEHLAVTFATGGDGGRIGGGFTRLRGSTRLRR